MNEIFVIMGIIFLLGLWLVGSVAWDIFRVLLDIKFELEDMNRKQKLSKDRPWNYTMKELEAAIKHE